MPFVSDRSGTKVARKWHGMYVHLLFRTLREGAFGRGMAKDDEDPGSIRRCRTHTLSSACSALQEPGALNHIAGCSACPVDVAVRDIHR